MELLKGRSKELEKLSLQVINAHEEERKNLASRLHDLVAQDLSATQLNLKLSQKVLPGEYREIKARLKESGQLLNNAIEDLRDLTSNLRPPVLDDFGLASALNWYIERFNRRTDSKISLKIGKLISKLPSEVETAIYRIIQEGLTNIAKHSQATREVVSLDQKGDNLRVIIQDNGIGFNPESSSFKEGYGLFELRETAKLLGGTAEIFAKVGEGTKLVITLPLTTS